MVNQLRLNDVKISVKGNKITINYRFDDISEKERELFVKYLIAEGFIKNKHDINIFIQSASPKNRKD